MGRTSWFKYDGMKSNGCVHVSSEVINYIQNYDKLPQNQTNKKDKNNQNLNVFKTNSFCLLHCQKKNKKRHNRSPATSTAQHFHWSHYTFKKTKHSAQHKATNAVSFHSISTFLCLILHRSVKDILKQLLQFLPLTLGPSPQKQ